MTVRDKGWFVVVEGMGGAGKSTLVANLGERLTEMGLRVAVTTEPSHGLLGSIARRDTDTFRGLSLACLVAADRYHHLATEIRPALQSGVSIICDRYVASSFVLQQIDGVPVSFIEALNLPADEPDLFVVLTLDPEIAVRRIAARGAHNRFESGVESSRRERDLYQSAVVWLRERGSIVEVVDTTFASEQDLAADVVTLLHDRMLLPRR